MSSASGSAAQLSHKRLHSETAPVSHKKPKIATNLPPLGHPIRTDFARSSIKASAAGYTAGTRNEKPDNAGIMAPEENLEQLRWQSWTYIRWDGSKARPLLDRENRSIAILAGIPQNELYQQRCEEARQTMRALGERSYTTDQMTHIRGPFPAFRVGVAFGAGQTRPHNLAISPNQQEIADRLLNSPGVAHLAEMQDAMFKQWIPRLYEFYESRLGLLWAHSPQLKANFPGSVWPAAAFNLSKQVVSRRHRDSQNLLYGICAITSLGDFDHTKGGHLVLPDLEMVIEFPAGSTILIPSALLEHANTPVGQAEERLSFTQYCAGSHFRFVDCGFKMVKELEASDPEQYEEFQQQIEPNTRAGWMKYSTMDELSACMVV